MPVLPSPSTPSASMAATVVLIASSSDGPVRANPSSDLTSLTVPIEHRHDRRAILFRRDSLRGDSRAGARPNDDVVPRVPEELAPALDEVLPLRQRARLDDARLDPGARTRVPHGGDTRRDVIHVHRRLDLDDGAYRLCQRPGRLTEQLPTRITTLTAGEHVRRRNETIDGTLFRRDGRRRDRR
jgi:hypothetical protein